MYSVMNVPLPNPINLIRKLIRLVKTGNSHNDSILTRIFNRINRCYYIFIVL